MVTTDSCVLHFAISERITRPWLGLRFVLGYAGRCRKAKLHAAGKFCDSTRDFLWIVSRCAPEFYRLLVGQNHLQHRSAKIQLQLTGGVYSFDWGAHGVGITACVWLAYAAFRFRLIHGVHHIVAGRAQRAGSPALNHKGKIQILTCGVTLGTFSISVERLKFTSRRHQKWSPPIHHNLWGYINGIGILGSEQNPAEWKHGNNFAEKG